MYYYAMGTNSARAYAIWSASRMKRHYSGERPASTEEPPCPSRGVQHQRELARARVYTQHMHSHSRVLHALLARIALHRASGFEYECVSVCACCGLRAQVVQRALHPCIHVQKGLDTPSVSVGPAWRAQSVYVQFSSVSMCK